MGKKFRDRLKIRELAPSSNQNASNETHKANNET